MSLLFNKRIPVELNRSFRNLFDLNLLVAGKFIWWWEICLYTTLYKYTYTVLLWFLSMWLNIMIMCSLFVCVSLYSCMYQSLPISEFTVAWYLFVVWVGLLVSISVYITCLVEFACYTNLLSIYSFFIQSMLSRSFNSTLTAVSSSHYGSSRDLHGSQGSLALSVADGRGSGGHIFRVSTYSRLVLLAHT